MLLLTVFTPTYNRKHTLSLGYNALKRQTNKNFIWLIIDDGSTDGTESLVRAWQSEDTGFEIQYIYKPNGGLHTAYNVAIENIKTELCVCIDSDDYMPDDAVDKILNYWEKNHSENIAGFIGRDYYPDGRLIGDPFPNVEVVHIVELVDKYKYKGDTKMVLRTKLLKEVAPQPTYNGEKNFNPIYLMILIDYKYPFKLMNENLCFVEYAETGMSNNIFKQYVNSPNSFAALRISNIKSPHASFRFKLKNYIHLGSSILLAKNSHLFKQVPNKLFLMLCLPLSGLLTLYIIKKAGV